MSLLTIVPCRPITVNSPPPCLCSLSRAAFQAFLCAVNASGAIRIIALVHPFTVSAEYTSVWISAQSGFWCARSDYFFVRNRCATLPFETPWALMQPLAETPTPRYLGRVLPISRAISIMLRLV